MAETTTLKAGLCLGRFTLVEKVALGGMAEIWSSVEALPDGGTRPRALKVLQPFYGKDRAFRAMFHDEVAIATRLRHANIVEVHAAFEENGFLFQSMELIDGLDVRRLLLHLAREDQWFPTGFALIIGRDVALGLDYAHKRTNDMQQPLKIVHRDISPHNVMVTREGRAKVLDFGIVHAAERSTRTRTGIVKGKLSYMAPEQALGGELSHRTDIFSTGVMLWEMLAMQRLFRAERDADVVEMITHGETRPVHELNPTVPEEVSVLIQRMLAKSPNDRPESMDAVARGFQRALARCFRVEDASADALGRWAAKYLGEPNKRPRTQVMEDVDAAAILAESEEPTAQTELNPAPPFMAEPTRTLSDAEPTRVDVEGGPTERGILTGPHGRR